MKPESKLPNVNGRASHMLHMCNIYICCNNVCVQIYVVVCVHTHVCILYISVCLHTCIHTYIQIYTHYIGI
jgi:hypothetical protein